MLYPFTGNIEKYYLNYNNYVYNFIKLLILIILTKYKFLIMITIFYVTFQIYYKL